MCQAAARFAIDANAAVYSFHYFYPSLSRELSRASGIQLDEMELAPAIVDFPGLVREWRRYEHLNFPAAMLMSVRPRLQEHFPARVPVDVIKAGIIRFLCYHALDYVS